MWPFKRKEPEPEKTLRDLIRIKSEDAIYETDYGSLFKTYREARFHVGKEWFTGQYGWEIGAMLNEDGDWMDSKHVLRWLEINK